MRVVLDSNILIAAVASRGLCEAILELCLENHHIVLCEGILLETRNKLQNKLKVSPPVIAEYLALLRNHAQLLAPDDVQKTDCRDPNDLMILGLIAPGKVDIVVTGDKDLLVIKEYGKAKILNPRYFWESNRNLK